MKEILRESIKMHYDNKDYTEVVRDAILCLMTEIRKKSNLQDDDGVDLINKAFSEKKPLIKINKLQTQTDKNKQRGVNDLSKGLVEYFRNPMSHSKQSYSKEVADALLVLVDQILLEEIVQSKSLNSVEDWYSEIINDLSPSTDRYVKALVNSIPQEKILELLFMLYENKKIISNDKMKLIEELIKKLSEDDFVEFCLVVEDELCKTSFEHDLIDIIRFISKEMWDRFNDLTRVKIEDMTLEDIQKFEIYWDDDSGEYGIVQNFGKIIISMKHLLVKFSNKEEIVRCIYRKLVDSKDNEIQFDFLIEHFFELISKEIIPEYDIIDAIYDRLKYRNKPIWYDRLETYLEGLDFRNEWRKKLSDAFKLFVPILDDDLPF